MRNAQWFDATGFKHHTELAQNAHRTIFECVMRNAQWDGVRIITESLASLASQNDVAMPNA